MPLASIHQINCVSIFHTEGEIYLAPCYISTTYFYMLFSLGFDLVGLLHFTSKNCFPQSSGQFDTPVAFISTCTTGINSLSANQPGNYYKSANFILAAFEIQ